MVLRITHEVIVSVKNSLSYSPETGVFLWKVEKNSFGGRAQIGAPAGSKHDGYIVIGVLRKQYRAHRLAWVVMTGEDVPPGKEIDHINRDRADNRWSNLRLIDRSRNNHNSNPHKNNTSGVKGVSWKSRDGKWDARIKINGKAIIFGSFDKFEDAVAARIDGEQAYLGESPTRQSGAPSIPKVARQKQKAPRWIDENRDQFRSNCSLKVRKTNTSGCPGVRLHKSSGLWHARIVVAGVEHSLGYFKEIAGAIEARIAAERLHFGRSHQDQNEKEIRDG